jgi:hypothetical protein
MKDESEQKRVNELKEYLDEKIAEHQRVLSRQAERRAASCAIKFGTSTTKVLTSATVLARIFLCEEWKMAKSLKKKDLIEKMIANYGFTNDIQASKLPELKQMAERYLLEREKELVETYQKELDKVAVPLPPAITTFFACPPNLEEENKEEAEEADSDELEKEFLAYLNRRLNDDEAEETNADSVLLSFIARLE